MMNSKFNELKNVLLNDPNSFKDLSFISNHKKDIVKIEQEAESAEVKFLLDGKIPLKSRFNEKDVIYVYLAHNTRSEEDEYRNQKFVSERFFRTRISLVPGKPAELLYQKIHQSIKNFHPVALDENSARSVISALVKIISDNDGFPKELRFTIGDTCIICEGAKEEAKKTQKGNFVISVTNEYFKYGSENNSEVGKRLNYIAPYPEHEKKLAELMTQKTKTINSFNVNEFTHSGQIKLPIDNELGEFTEDQMLCIQKNIHYLNGLNFLRSICEVVRRLYRVNDEISQYKNLKLKAQRTNAQNSDGVPIALFQARTAALLMKGTILQNDVFGSSDCYGETKESETRDRKVYNSSGKGYHRAKFGIATGMSTIKNLSVMLEKAKFINEMTETNVIKPCVFDKHSIYTLPPNKFSEIVVSETVSIAWKAGKNRLRQELVNEFGGDEETDSDYSNVAEEEDLTRKMENLKVKKDDQAHGSSTESKYTTVKPKVPGKR